MVVITVLATLYFIYVGYTYYGTPMEERFYHPKHNWFKPSGLLGLDLGIYGTILITFGVFIYIARKRYNFLERFIRLKYLLEFHIFLCTLGPIMILFHTAFKFGGIVSIAFWSMVAVVLSGVVGRYIYIQIPRTIEGRELTLNEIKDSKTKLTKVLEEKFELSQNFITSIFENKNNYGTSIKLRAAIKKGLKNAGVNTSDRKIIMKIIKEERALSKKITRLEMMKKLFKYWHVIHMPFAIIMLIIVIIHIAIAFLFVL